MINKYRLQDRQKWLSAVTDDEAAMLRVLAEGKYVLEIGSFTGYSADIMADSAIRVDCVDPFVESEPTLFINNLKNRSNVFLHIGTSSTIVPGLIPNFDMVFIDGDHSYRGVQTDLDLAFDKVKFGGLIVCHDYDVFAFEPNKLDPPGQEVKPAIDDWLEFRCTFPMLVDVKDDAGFTHKEQRMEFHPPEIKKVDSMIWFTVNWK